MSSFKEDNWVRRFTVTDPFKHAKGFTLYKITSLVFPKKYPEALTKIVIWKRYNDFKKLHKELKTRYKKLSLSDSFPPFVKGKFFSRFEADVIEERRQAALNLLDFVAQHPPLFTSDVFVKFFESGYDVNSADGSVVRRSASPILNRPSLGQGSSDDDRTSFTTDTDSVVTPPQMEEGDDDDDEQLSVSLEDDSWLSRRLRPSQSQSTLASVESLLQSFKNRFIGSSDADKVDPVSSGSSGQYCTEAQQEAEEAEGREHAGEHLAAFTGYKTAIAQLLSGVQGDTDNERRRLVQERTTDYLCKAEFIANNYLSSESSPQNKCASKENELVPLSKLWQPFSDLQWFKVVGVVAKVMLVIDTRNNYLFIIKALYKSALPVVKNRSCIFPRRIPYMVELNSIFETDNSVFLVLQYVSGGKLWDYVSPLLQKHQETPRRAPLGKNPYGGYYCLQSDLASISTSASTSPLHQPVTDLETRSAVSSPGDSYLNLLRDYQATRDHPPPEPSPPPPEPSPPPPEHSPTPALSLRPTTPSPPHFTLNVQDVVDMDTKELVEHAQRLLQSVDVTLQESESVLNRANLAGETHRLTEPDRLSVSSQRSLDITRLLPAFSSKGSSPVSSVGVEGVAQWCQLEPGVAGVGVAQETVRRWAAQLLVALHALHQTGVTCLDLNPDNVLVVGATVRLTYFCSFPGVEPQVSWWARTNLYTAPELSSIFPVTPAADWWSLGTLLYHLLTGQSLSSFYPGGIFCHTILYIPDTVSAEARSLLKELLRHNPSERLGSGILGVEEIKSHPFFDGIQWDQIYNEGLLPI